MTRKPITPKPITPKKNARKIATQSAASCKPVASPWSLSRLVAWLPLVAVLFMAGCVDEDSPTMYAMCGGEHEDVEIKRLVNGNLVIVANYREEGFNSATLISDMFLGIALNGIDFSDLASYKISFDKSTGAYSLGNDKAKVGFTLFFETDFEKHAAGDFIPYNIFKHETFVKNVKVSVGSDLKVSGSYDPGPLYGLVKGDVKFSAPLNVKLKVDALRMAIKINSVQTYGGSWPFNKDDKLTMHMSTTPMSLDHFTQQLQDGGLGIDYSGSRYVSQFFGIEQDFSDAVFYIVRKDQGWSFEGTYLTEMTKWGTTLYAKGFVSNVAQDNTAYYCDADLTTHIGTAWHALELTDGYFEFADGTRFTYGLSAY